MKLLIGFLVVTMLVALYVIWLRPWLRDKEWAAGFFAWIEPAERLLFKKSESILWARFLKVIGLGVPFLQAVGAVDITPYMAIIPEGYGPYLLLLIFVAGQMGEWLRKDTTQPLEIVAIPDNAPPEVKRAAEDVKIQNEISVAKVEDAKAEGTM
jgi:hypothetical protein